MPREPQEAGSIKPIALARLGAVEEAPTESSAQEITAPFRPRLSRCGRSVGARSVWKNSQTRPQAASDCSSEPPRRTLVLGPAEMCAVATAGMQAEGVRRGLRTEISRLFCSPQRKRPGRQADLRSKSVLQVCAPGNCAGSRPATSSGAAAHSRVQGETCSGHSEQLTGRGLLRKPLGPQAGPGTCRQQAALQSRRPHTGRTGAGSKLLARTRRPALMRAPAPGSPSPLDLKSSARLF